MRPVVRYSMKSSPFCSSIPRHRPYVRCTLDHRLRSTETHYRAPVFSFPVLYKADVGDWTPAVLYCCIIAPDLQLPERGTSCTESLRFHTRH